MVARVYSYNDAGAENLRLSGAGNDKLINILKAVLVDGYGTKPGAGWTLAFDSPATNKAVFQQGSGSNAFLRITGMDSRLNEIDPFISMTDIETGDKGKWRNTSDLTRGLWGQFWNGDNSITDGILFKWVIVADDKFFSLASMSNNSTNDTYIQTLSFGDYDTGGITVDKPLYFECKGQSKTVSILKNNNSFYSKFPTYSNAIHNIYNSYLSGDSDGHRVNFDINSESSRSFSYSYHPYPDRLTGGLLIQRAVLINRANSQRLGFHPFIYQPINLHYPGQTNNSPLASEFSEDVFIFDGKGDFLNKKIATIIGLTQSGVRLGIVMVGDE